MENWPPPSVYENLERAITQEEKKYILESARKNILILDSAVKGNYKLYDFTIRFIAQNSKYLPAAGTEEHHQTAEQLDQLFGYHIFSGSNSYFDNPYKALGAGALVGLSTGVVFGRSVFKESRAELEKIEGMTNHQKYIYSRRTFFSVCMKCIVGFSAQGELMSLLFDSIRKRDISEAVRNAASIDGTIAEIYYTK
jgi:hypothetical protein